jgi:hypothetical protein
MDGDDAERERDSIPGVCTWLDIRECSGCVLHNNLKCRFDIKAQIFFIVLFSCFAVPAIMGMIMGGYGWYLSGWFIFMLLNFTFWEARVLCSHCPFWAEKSTVLRCLANSGTIKLFKFHPEPASLIEKVQFVIIVIILIGYPFPFMLAGTQYIMAGVAFCGAVLFAWVVYMFSCSRCVNFSCIFNHVPRHVIEKYLDRNPVMKKVWREKEYTRAGQ